jgi:hypothetical protein
VTALSVGVGWSQIVNVLNFGHALSAPTQTSSSELCLNITEHLHDFVKQSMTAMNTQGSEYDYGSIMHYGPYTFAVDKSKPSISPQPNHVADGEMGQRLAQSTADVWRIQKLYSCTIDTAHITRPSSSRKS